MAETKKKDSLKYIAMDPINQTGAAFGVSTIKGGGPWKELSEEGFKVYKSLSDLLHTDTQHMVRPEQKHTDVVLKVEESMGGQGVIRELPKPAADGLITNIPGMALCVLTADCVPVALADPVHRAVGMVHSGWRGTKARISLRALEQMEKEYGTNPADVIVWIGPHICRDCYEVGPELITEFAKNFSEEETRSLFHPKDDSHYLLDMSLAIRIPLIAKGVPEENIFMSGKCTFEDKTLNSYRRDLRDGREFSGRNLSAIVVGSGPLLKTLRP